MVLFIVLYKVVLIFKSVDESIQMKATELCFHVVLFIMLHKVVLAWMKPTAYYCIIIQII